MSSLDYFVLELSSVKNHESKQALSLYIKAEGGDMEILPNHEECEFNFKAQTVYVKFNGVNKNEVIPIYLEDGYLKMTLQKDGRSTVQLLTFNYSFDENDNIYRNKVDDYDNQVEKSNILLTNELLPVLNDKVQEIRNIDSELRKEFEQNL
jgi:F0F1-type ATP synthase epsilon subunit